MVCERGTMFGYSDLIVDPRNLVLMRDAGCPVTADVTHALQQPTGKALEARGALSVLHLLCRLYIFCMNWVLPEKSAYSLLEMLLQGGGVASGGLRELIPAVARTAAAVGVDGIFMEVQCHATLCPSQPFCLLSCGRQRDSSQSAYRFMTTPLLLLLMVRRNGP